MKFYAEVQPVKARQILGDIATALWIVVWIRIGSWMYSLVMKLQGPGRSIEGAGRGLNENLTSVAQQIEDVPLVGGELRSPFDAAAGAARSLADAGQAHQDVVYTLAVWLGILLAIIPIGYVLLKYLPPRIRWVREASAASSLRIDSSDLELFALRAVATRPLYDLKRACDDPAKALAERDFMPLARLELGALGLSIPD